MKCFEKSKPMAAMLGVNFGLAVANVLFKKAISGGLSHLVLITCRQSISVVFLAPLGYCLERKNWPTVTRRLIWYLFLSGLLGPTLTGYFYLIGLKYTSATFASAFINTSPVMTFVMALCFRQEKLNVRGRSGRAKVLGSLICLGGFLILTLYKGMPIINMQHASKDVSMVPKTSHHSTKRWAIGSVFLGLNILTWSSWFLMQARIGKSFPFPYSSTAIMSFFSAIHAAVLCLAIERNLSVWIIKGPIEISAILYAGIVASSLCYVAMSWCIKIRGPVFTSAFSPFVQIFTAILDVSILHDQIHLGSILGSSIVIIGMYILLWGKSLDQVQQEEKNGDGSREPQLTMAITEHPLKT